MSAQYKRRVALQTFPITNQQMKSARGILLLILFQTAAVQSAFAESIVTGFKVKLVCNLIDKTNLVSPKGTSETKQMLSGEIVDVKVTHLDSAPDRQLISINAMGTPYIQYYMHRLFKSEGKSCSVDFDDCRASFSDEEIRASATKDVDGKMTQKDITIDRSTGRLIASHSSINHGMVLTHELSGYCKKAPAKQAF